MATEISIALFSDLDNIAKALLANKQEVEEEEAHTLNSHRAKDYMQSFLNNFFIQFFSAFNCSIDGANARAVFAADDCFRKKEKERPKNVFNSFMDVINIWSDLQVAVYHDPPRDKVIRQCCLSYLIKLHQNLTLDERISRTKIANYDQILNRLTENIALLKQV